jgi:hypothetical protein
MTIRTGEGGDGDRGGGKLLGEKTDGSFEDYACEGCLGISEQAKGSNVARFCRVQ